MDYTYTLGLLACFWVGYLLNKLETSRERAEYAKMFEKLTQDFTDAERRTHALTRRIDAMQAANLKLIEDIEHLIDAEQLE